MIGLVLAARSFNNAARSAGKNAKVVLFLRSDIYDRVLHFPDKNKITDTFADEIEWDQGGSTLRALMEKRFERVVAPRSTWTDVFDETVEMPRRQGKYSYIRDRTLLRPRDIIRFCNAVLGEYKKRRRDHPGSPSKFVNADVRNARLEYSKYLRKEFEDEVIPYYSDFRTYLEILRQVSWSVFFYDQFDEAYAVWRKRLKRKVRSEEILRRLFDFSIIGFYRQGGGLGGSEYVFSYREPNLEFNSSADRYRVHRGLIESLALKEGSPVRRVREATVDDRPWT